MARGAGPARSAVLRSGAAAVPLGYALAAMKRLSIIAAVAANGVIGRGNGLPWHLAGDLKWFKTLTLGHHLIMGRRTFDSVGKPLPGRTTVVITRNASFGAPGVLVAPNVEQA